MNENNNNTEDKVIGEINELPTNETNKPTVGDGTITPIDSVTRWNEINKEVIDSANEAHEKFTAEYNRLISEGKTPEEAEELANAALNNDDQETAA